MLILLDRFETRPVGTQDIAYQASSVRFVLNNFSSKW